MYNEFIRDIQRHKEPKEINEGKLKEVFDVTSDLKHIVEILNEPPFNQVKVTCLHDLRNMGYCGDTIDVYAIKDLRMLVNHYIFLQTPTCRNTYTRINRHYEKVLHRASHRLLSIIADSDQCKNIPVDIGKSQLTFGAGDVAKILLINCYTNQDEYDFNRWRDEINFFAEQMMYYFYAHIDHYSIAGHLRSEVE